MRISDWSSDVCSSDLHYDGQGIAVTQEKTGERLWVSCHKALKALLDNEIPKRDVVIFTTATGRPWKEDHMRHEVRKHVAKCGFAGYSLHGLRKNAAKNLAEAGCREHKIAAITGHRTLAMVAKYTRAAHQKRMSKAAIRKLERKFGRAHVRN